MDLGRAFSFPFQDKDWIMKVLIGGLIMLIPFIGAFVVLGWSLEITRRVIYREPELLPEWSDFGGHLVRGLKALVIGLVYALPIILLSICASLPSAFAGNGDSDMVTVASIVSICFSCVAVLLGLFLAVFSIAGMGNFAATGDLGSAFRFNEIISQVRANPMPYVMAVLGAVLAGIAASIVGTILCVIGSLFTSVYAYAVQGHLMGQAHNQAGGARANASYGGAQTF